MTLLVLTLVFELWVLVVDLRADSRQVRHRQCGAAKSLHYAALVSEACDGLAVFVAAVCLSATATCWVGTKVRSACFCSQ